MTLSSWLLASNAIFFIFSALAITASIAVFLLTRANDREKDRVLAAYQAEQGAKFAAANADTSKALAVAASAQQLAADAQLKIDIERTRASGYEKDAADARLETEKLKAKLAWRELKPDQLKLMVAAARARLSAVNIRYASGDPESAAYAIKIANGLIAAGWQVAIRSISDPNGIYFGVGISREPAAISATIASVFSAAKISHSVENLPPEAMSVGNRLPNAGEVFVGVKPQQ